MVRVCVFVIFFLPIVAVSQSTGNGKLHSYFTLYSQAGGTLAPRYEPFDEFVSKLGSKRASFKTERAFVHHLFGKAHQAFFRQFREYASFADLVSKGDYNCLSGTALYGLLLDHFQIDYRIIETNYHIFLLVRTREGLVLLESTDGEKGFVNDPKIIAERVSNYRDLRPENVNSRERIEYHYRNVHSDTVTLTGILGLLHYNHSVEAFNSRDFRTAITHLHHALLLHRSEKIETYLNVMYTTVLFDESLQQEVKQNYLERLRGLRSKKRARANSVLMVPLIR